MAAITPPAEVRATAAMIHDAEEVGRVLDTLAASITAAVAGKDPVVLAVMNGGAFVATELCKRFEFLYEFDYAHATRYGHELEGGVIEWKVLPSERIRDRVVVVVDDVLDRGSTLQSLLTAVRDIGAAEIYTAVLVRKQLDDDPQRPEVDFVGLETQDVFLFGCGMDYAGYWRGLPALYGAKIK